LQAWDFAPGANFVAEMQQASEQTQAVLALVSERYLESGFTTDEWTAAFRERKLLPVRIGGDRPGGILGPIVSVDLVGVDQDSARDRLIEAAGRFLAVQRGETGRAKPSEPPPFPRPAAERPVATPAPFPGDARLRHLPRGPNPNFTGRQDELDQIESMLAEEGRVALAGLGGLGKSRLAIEYAHRHAVGYDVVWWLRAETPATLVEDLAGLGFALGVVSREAPDLTEAANTALRQLEQEGQWLLIFDDAPGPDAIEPFLPTSGDGHVIVTSREPAWRGFASPLRLPLLAASAAAAFLRERSGDVEGDAAEPLAKELGFLPLALEQAGAYVEENGTTLAAYLTAFREHQAEILSEGEPPDYPAPVATTWELSFRTVEDDAPAAAVLLELLAFLASDATPSRLFREYLEHLPSALAEALARPLGFDREIARPLLRYSLVERDGDDISVHRLVQAVTRGRMNSERRTERINVVMALLQAAFEFDSANPSGWPWCGRLLSHVVSATLHASALGIDPSRVAVLVNTTGLYLRYTAQYGEARAAFERALAIDEAVHGSRHPAIARDVNNLGLVLRDLGDLVGARAAFERALAIDEAVHGSEHPAVARIATNLNAVLGELEK
jgi:tetratricopeptide (TPR) repeat protein